MSYCRWSSDNWKCDLYCYPDVNGGYTTHIAGNRVVGAVPEELDILTAEPDAWVASHKRAMDWLETAQRRPIGLPHDGATFRDATLEEFKARLLMLRAAGYCFPDYVLAEIDEEIAAEASEGEHA